MNYELTIDHDHDTERPDENSLARVISFNNRHTAYKDPEQWLEAATNCKVCDGDGWERVDRQPNGSALVECSKCDGLGYTTAVHADVLATLSYYEHGLCRWMVGDSSVPDHGGFDTVQFGGVLVWNGEDDERVWFDGLSDKRRREILDGIALEYSEWCNGECYSYSLVQLTTFHDCPNCGGHADGGINESCGGFVGRDAILEDLRLTVSSYNIDPDEIEIKGEADYLISTTDLETKEATV